MKNSLLFIFLVVLLSNKFFCQSVLGPNTTTVVSDNGSGSYPWYINNPQTPGWYQNSIVLSNGLVFKDFGFNVPPTSTIVGVEVGITYSCAISSIVKDTIVRLLVNNLESGLNNSTLQFYTSQAIITPIMYGDSSSLWGNSLSPADINSSNFGFVLYVYNQNGFTNMHVINFGNFTFMNVYYAFASGIIESQSRSPINVYAFNRTLYVSGLNGTNHLEISDLSDSKVMETRISDKSEIDLSSFPSGMYIYRLSGNYSRSGKFVLDYFNIIERYTEQRFLLSNYRYFLKVDK